MQPEEISDDAPTVESGPPVASRELDPEPAPEPVSEPTGETGETGDPAVDELLASVATLDDLPVEEHVVVFEQAHDRLRRALDARPDS